MNEAFEGGCLCGQVRFRVSGAVENSMICHCQSCRRAAGAPVMAWLSVAMDAFEVIQGNPAEFQSSAGVHRAFCRACGTPLTYRHDKRPQSIDLTTCSLDDPDAYPPSHHSWLSDDVGWLRFGDGLPAFPEWRND